MKKLLLLLAVMSLATVANAQLLITGIFDGPLTGGLPKLVELYACDDIDDLSVYGIGSASNGGGTDGVEYTFPADFIPAGTSIYVSSEAGTSFQTYFGVAFSYNAGAAVSINGDDAIELFYTPVGGSPVVVDTFGDITYPAGTGPSLLWNHLDGWAKRNTMTGPDGGLFILSSWTFSGMNATDGCTTNAGCASVFPLGTGFECSAAVSEETQSFGAVKSIFR